MRIKTVAIVLCLAMCVGLGIGWGAAKYENRQRKIEAQEQKEQEQKEEQKEAEESKDDETLIQRKLKIVDMREVAPGDILSAEEIGMDTGIYFKSYEIQEGDAVYQRINGRSYRQNPNIGLDQLRYLKMIHYNFDHQVQVGEMIVNAEVADKVLQIFEELYKAEYEINSMYLIDNYWTGDGGTSDVASIRANNTSSFCYRAITGGSQLSNHAYGYAIDINPWQNPYAWYEGNALYCSPADSAAYLDREMDDPHVIKRGDLCYSVFQKYGYSWGGNWKDPIDYQHFEWVR